MVRWRIVSPRPPPILPLQQPPPLLHPPTITTSLRRLHVGSSREEGERRGSEGENREIHLRVSPLKEAKNPRFGFGCVAAPAGPRGGDRSARCDGREGEEEEEEE